MDWENPKDILKALALLYGLQTEDEQARQATSHDNGVGFNATDARFLSSVAEQMLIRKRGISVNQVNQLKAILPTYRGQIERLGIDHIELPPTAVIYDSEKEKVPDCPGKIIAGKDILLFKPYIFPTKILKERGFRWVNGYWQGKLNIESLNQLRDLFPESEEDPSVKDWEDGVINIDSWESTEFTDDLFAYQRQGIGFAVQQGRALLGLSPGLGKSAIAIMAAKHKGGKTLIIAPLSLVRNWRKEIKRWIGEESVIAHGHVTDEADWTITNYETVLNRMVRYDTKKQKLKSGRTINLKVNWRTNQIYDFNNVIVDESILVKNRKAQRTKAVGAVCKSAQNVWLLSGSPTSRYLDDMWSQFNILDPRRFSSYWNFVETYCMVDRNKWGWSIIGNLPGAEANLKRNCKDVYFSRTQKQVLDIPDWIFEDYEVEMTSTQYKLYQEMETTFLAELPNGDEILAGNILTQLLRLVQFASNPLLLDGPDSGAKWDALPEILDFVEFPVIVWTNFKKTAQLIASHLTILKHVTAPLTGDVSADDRQEVVDAFQNGELDVLVAHPAVGKFGHTLTRARTAIYLERSYNGDDYYQSLYRVKRIGTEHSPHIVHLLAARPGSDDPTVDHVIDRVLKARRDNSFAITSGEIREYFQER